MGHCADDDGGYCMVSPDDVKGYALVRPTSSVEAPEVDDIIYKNRVAQRR